MKRNLLHGFTTSRYPILTSPPNNHREPALGYMTQTPATCVSFTPQVVDLAENNRRIIEMADPASHATETELKFLFYRY